MKILSSNDYTKMKMDQYKRDPNMEQDEYGTPSKWVSIYGSPVGYFGLEEEVEDYRKIHEAIEKTIYGEIVAEASRLSTLAIAEFRKNNPTKKMVHVDEEFTYKGIPCHYSVNTFDGLCVDIHTQYVIDNYDKLDIDIPELNRVPFNKGFSTTKSVNKGNTGSNFSERLMKCFNFGYCATVRFPGNNDHTDFKNYKVVRVYTEADNDRDVKYQLGKILDKKYGYSWSIEDIKSPVSESSCDMHIFDLQRLVNQ